MVTKHWQKFFQDFDAHYERWITAQESGDPDELRTAEKALPGLTDRARQALAALDRDESDSPLYAARKRWIVLDHERRAYERKRRREQEAAKQRREARSIRINRTVELPTTCAHCGAKLENPKSTGRPRVYCSASCRKAAHEDRRSGNESAVKVQVVERVVTEVRERRVDVTHPRKTCVQAVFDDEAAIVEAVRALTARIRDFDDPILRPTRSAFWDLCNDVEVLHEALAERAMFWRPLVSPDPPNRHQRNLQRFTYKPSREGSEEEHDLGSPSAP
ncbi:hypothetical protein [Leucobacter celer]|uniref:hypothetical protein n=1 Tax=Leucobacter celer TaxID=668625 RepID=UPI000A91AE55|nr:hypothetical protein [Leucobacter celer]